MSKLLKLKEWLTIKEAAKHISVVLGEKITVKDIYRLALDKHLTLSVNFINHTYAEPGQIVGTDNIKWSERPRGNPFLDRSDENYGKPYSVMLSLQVDEDKYVNFDGEVKLIEGVWDLPMWGAEELDIEHQYQRSTGGPEVTLINIDGTFVTRGNVVCKLMESYENNEYIPGSMAQKKNLIEHIRNTKMPTNEADKLRSNFEDKRKNFFDERTEKSFSERFYPAGGLPRDAVFVVRTHSIIELLNSLNEEVSKSNKPLSTKERHTLLVLIASILQEQGINYQQRGIAAAIQRMTEKLGTPVSDDSIRGVLNQIDEAIAHRSK